MRTKALLIVLTAAVFNAFIAFTTIATCVLLVCFPGVILFICAALNVLAFAGTAANTAKFLDNSVDDELMLTHLNDWKSEVFVFPISKAPAYLIDDLISKFLPSRK